MFSTGNGADGGKLHYVELNAVLTKAVDAGKTVTFSANSTGNFKTAYAMKLNASDLYFYSDGGTITSEVTGTAMGDAQLETISGVNSTLDSTYRAGDFPRFTAEFVIVARD